MNACIQYGSRMLRKKSSVIKLALDSEDENRVSFLF